MSYQGQRILAVVPARGGSKEIPRKNLCKIGEDSLVARAAKIAKSVDWIDCSIISTDDLEIEQEGLESGLRTIGTRPAVLSGDTAKSLDVWRHAWAEAERLQNEEFGISLLLEPTSPFREVEDLRRVIAALVGDGRSSAVTVSRSPDRYAPEKALKIINESELHHYHGPGYDVTRRQDVPQYFHRNGICYGVKKSRLFDEGEIFGYDCEAVVIERPVINIDSRQDLIDARSWLDSKMPVDLDEYRSLV